MEDRDRWRSSSGLERQHHEIRGERLLVHRIGDGKSHDRDVVRERAHRHGLERAIRRAVRDLQPLIGIDQLGVRDVVDTVSVVVADRQGRHTARGIETDELIARSLGAVQDVDVVLTLGGDDAVDAAVAVDIADLGARDLSRGGVDLRERAQKVRVDPVAHHEHVGRHERDVRCERKPSHEGRAGGHIVERHHGGGRGERAVARGAGAIPLAEHAGGRRRDQRGTVVAVEVEIRGHRAAGKARRGSRRDIHERRLRVAVLRHREHAGLVRARHGRPVERHQQLGGGRGVGREAVDIERAVAERARLEARIARNHHLIERTVDEVEDRHEDAAVGRAEKRAERLVRDPVQPDQLEPTVAIGSGQLARDRHGREITEGRRVGHETVGGGHRDIERPVVVEIGERRPSRLERRHDRYAPREQTTRVARADHDRRAREADDVAGAVTTEIGDREVVDLERPGGCGRCERAARRVAQAIRAARVRGVRAVRRCIARDRAAHATRFARVAVLTRLDETVATDVAAERVKARARRGGHDEQHQRVAHHFLPPPNGFSMSSLPGL